MTLLNLTGEPVNREGVQELTPADTALVKRLQQFKRIPTQSELINVAAQIASLTTAYSCKLVLIDPPNYLVSPLAYTLEVIYELQVCFSFTGPVKYKQMVGTQEVEYHTREHIGYVVYTVETGEAAVKGDKL